MNRDLILYGTTEPVAPFRHVTAGRLSAEIDRGNVRYVRWDGFEVLRAISFIVRDTVWGTYAPRIENFRVEETADRFAVRYSASSSSKEGDFRYDAEIVGTDTGSLRFACRGNSTSGFTTNRTGFVVLHGLSGVAGKAVEIEHTTGERTQSTFPDFVTPDQPAFDIRALTHSPRPGLTVSVRMAGDAFEMEDQRNWTDASFKTYVRPLSRGWPYKIEVGETLDQSVTLTVDDAAPTAAAPHRPKAVITVGGKAGIVPAIGLACLPEDFGRAGQLAGLRPSYLVGRIDARAPKEQWGVNALAELAGTMGCALDLDLVIPAKDPKAELTALRRALDEGGVQPGRVLVVPARDLKSRQVNDVPDGEADPAAILEAARAAFLNWSVGGGTVVGFPELNRNRPPAGIDFVAHSTQAIVHAADDVSVFETLEALADIVRSIRRISPGVPYRLGPGTIGAPAPFYAVTPGENPASVRKTTAHTDPRQAGLFGAAFAAAYAATAARLDVENVTLACCDGPAGLFGAVGLLPIAEIVKYLAALSGSPMLQTNVAGENVETLASSTDHGVELWVINTSAEPIDVRVEGAAFSRMRMLDVAALERRPAAEIGFEDGSSGALRLDSYAVCCLRER